jgi:CheY-like chemotaxis protein
VDDDPDDREDLKKALAFDGESFMITGFSNGLELLQHLSTISAEEHFPNYIILDIEMPIWDGFRTLQRLKAESRYANIPVIMYTTFTLQLEKESCLKQGAIEFIPKPNGQHEWERVIQTFRTHLSQTLPATG